MTTPTPNITIPARPDIWSQSDWTDEELRSAMDQRIRHGVQQDRDPDLHPSSWLIEMWLETDHLLVDATAMADPDRSAFPHLLTCLEGRIADHAPLTDQVIELDWQARVCWGRTAALMPWFSPRLVLWYDLAEL